MGWGDTWGVERSVETGAHLGAQTGAHVISVPYLFHGACPWRGRGRRGWPAACRALAAVPPTSTPHADMHASPCSCEDRQKEGREQSQHPLHPPPSRLRSPLCCLVPRSLHCLEQPWLPLCSLPSALEPLRKRLGEWFSSLLSTIHPRIERPGRRRGGQRLVSPLASLSCYCPSEPTLTM